MPAGTGSSRWGDENITDWRPYLAAFEAALREPGNPVLDDLRGVELDRLLAAAGIDTNADGRQGPMRPGAGVGHVTDAHRHWIVQARQFRTGGKRRRQPQRWRT